MLAAEIPPQESRPKKKRTAPKPESSSSNADFSFGPSKVSKDLPKKSDDGRGSVSFLRKNLEEKKTKPTSDEVLSALDDVAKIEEARVALANKTLVDMPAIRSKSESFADKDTVADAIKEVDDIEALRVAPATLVDMPAIRLKSESFADKDSVADALKELEDIEAKRVAPATSAKVSENFSKKESLEQLPKHDTIAEMDIFQVRELENAQLWKDAQPYIAKNIDDLKRVMEERAVFDGLPKKMQSAETRNKLDKASAVIRSNYEKIRAKLSASDEQLAKLYKENATSAIEDRLKKLFPVFRDKGLEGVPEEDALVYKIDAVRSLMDEYADKPKKVEAYAQIAADLNKRRRELTSERISVFEKSDKKVGEYKPSIERAIERQKEDLMAIELEVNGLRTIGDAGARELIPILLKQYNAIREQLSTNTEKKFFKEGNSEDETSSLDSFADNDIDVREKLIRAALARNQDKPAIVAEANRRLAAIAKQREEIADVLSQRSVNINSGESAYPRTMGRADRGVSVSVGRGRPGEILGIKEERAEQERRALSPFVAMENFINRARTENLFSDGEYLPGVLKAQYIQLMEARKKSLSEGKNEEVKEIDRIANGITSALRNMDLDRINEALGTIQNRLDQATEKYKENVNDSVAAAPWQEKIRVYQEQLSEASHDAGDFLSRDVDGRLAALGITEEDYKTIHFGKVSLFSNARLWWIKTRHGGEIAKISTMMKRRNELQGRQDGQKL